MIRGLLKFDTSTSVPSGQIIKITVLDTARVGADATSVAETSVTIPEDFDTATTDLPFEINFGGDGEGLTLRAHMPRHAGFDVREGDMVTTAAIPVRKDDEIAVTLQQV